MPAGVTLPKGSAAPFAVDADTLAWAGVPKTHGVCPHYHVYTANLRAFRPKSIWSGAQCAVVSDVRISPDWIVWESGVSPAGTIWAYSRATGRRYRVADQRYPLVNHPCSSLACVPNVGMSLDRNTLVWSHSVFTPLGVEILSSIRERRLPFGPTRTVYSTYTNCQMQIDPQFAGGRIVWLRAVWPRVVTETTAPVEQCAGLLRTDVMTVNGRGYPRQITLDGSATDPQTNGQFVTWEDQTKAPPKCVCSGLELLNVATGNYRLLDPSVGDSRMTNKSVVWIHRSDRATIVKAIDLGTQTVRTLGSSGVASSRLFIRTLGWPWKQRIVWEQDDLTADGAVRVKVQIRSE